MDFGSWGHLSRPRKEEFDIQSLFHPKRLQELKNPPQKKNSPYEPADPRMLLQWSKCVGKFSALRAHLSDCWDDHAETEKIIVSVRKELKEYTSRLLVQQPNTRIDPLPLKNEAHVYDGAGHRPVEQMKAMDELHAALQSGNPMWLDTAIQMCRHARVNEHKLAPSLRRLEKWKALRDGAQVDVLKSVPDSVADNGKSAQTRSALRRAMASRDPKIVKRAIDNAEYVLCSDDNTYSAAKEELQRLESRREGLSALQRALKTRNVQELQDALDLFEMSTDMDDDIISKARAALKTEKLQQDAKHKLSYAMKSEHVEDLQQAIDEASNNLLDDTENQLGEARKRLATLKVVKTLHDAAASGNIVALERAIDNAGRVGVSTSNLNRAQRDLSALRMKSLIGSEDPTAIRSHLSQLDESDPDFDALHARLVVLETKKSVRAAMQTKDADQIALAFDEAEMLPNIRRSLKEDDFDKLDVLVEEREESAVGRRSHPTRQDSGIQLQNTPGASKTSTSFTTREAALEKGPKRKTTITIGSFEFPIPAPIQDFFIQRSSSLEEIKEHAEEEQEPPSPAVRDEVVKAMDHVNEVVENPRSSLMELESAVGNAHDAGVTNKEMHRALSRISSLKEIAAKEEEIAKIEEELKAVTRTGNVSLLREKIRSVRGTKILTEEELEAYEMSADDLEAQIAAMEDYRTKEAKTKAAKEDIEKHLDGRPSISKIRTTLQAAESLGIQSREFRKLSERVEKIEEALASAKDALRTNDGPGLRRSLGYAKALSASASDLRPLEHHLSRIESADFPENYGEWFQFVEAALEEEPLDMQKLRNLLSEAVDENDPYAVKIKDILATDIQVQDAVQRGSLNALYDMRDAAKRQRMSVSRLNDAIQEAEAMDAYTLAMESTTPREIDTFLKENDGKLSEYRVEMLKARRAQLASEPRRFKSHLSRLPSREEAQAQAQPKMSTGMQEAMLVGCIDDIRYFSQLGDTAQLADALAEGEELGVDDQVLEEGRAKFRALNNERVRRSMNDTQVIEAQYPPPVRRVGPSQHAEEQYTHTHRRTGGESEGGGGGGGGGGEQWDTGEERVSPSMREYRYELWPAEHARPTGGVLGKISSVSGTTGQRGTQAGGQRDIRDLDPTPRDDAHPSLRGGPYLVKESIYTVTEEWGPPPLSPGQRPSSSPPLPPTQQHWDPTRHTQSQPAFEPYRPSAMSRATEGRPISAGGREQSQYEDWAQKRPVTTVVDSRHGSFNIRATPSPGARLSVAKESVYEQWPDAEAVKQTRDSSLSHLRASGAQKSEFITGGVGPAESPPESHGPSDGQAFYKKSSNASRPSLMGTRLEEGEGKEGKEKDFDALHKARRVQPEGSTATERQDSFEQWPAGNAFQEEDPLPFQFENWPAGAFESKNASTGEGKKSSGFQEKPAEAFESGSRPSALGKKSTLGSSPGTRPSGEQITTPAQKESIYEEWPEEAFESGSRPSALGKKSTLGSSPGARPSGAQATTPAQKESIYEEWPEEAFESGSRPSALGKKSTLGSSPGARPSGAQVATPAQKESIFEEWPAEAFESDSRPSPLGKISTFGSTPGSRPSGERLTPARPLVEEWPAEAFDSRPSVLGQKVYLSEPRSTPGSRPSGAEAFLSDSRSSALERKSTLERSSPGARPSLAQSTTPTFKKQSLSDEWTPESDTPLGPTRSPSVAAPGSGSRPSASSMKPMVEEEHHSLYTATQEEKLSLSSGERKKSSIFKYHDWVAAADTPASSSDAPAPHTPSDALPGREEEGGGAPAFDAFPSTHLKKAHRRETTMTPVIESPEPSVEEPPLTTTSIQEHTIRIGEEEGEGDGEEVLPYVEEPPPGLLLPQEALRPSERMRLESLDTDGGGGGGALSTTRTSPELNAAPVGLLTQKSDLTTIFSTQNSSGILRSTLSPSQKQMEIERGESISPGRLTKTGDTISAMERTPLSLGSKISQNQITQGVLKKNTSKEKLEKDEKEDQAQTSPTLSKQDSLNATSQSAPHESLGSAASPKKSVRYSTEVVLTDDEKRAKARGQALDELNNAMRRTFIDPDKLEEAIEKAKAVDLAGSSRKGLRALHEAEFTMQEQRQIKAFMDIVNSKDKEAISRALEDAPNEECRIQGEAMIENLEQEELQNVLDAYDEAEQETAGAARGGGSSSPEVRVGENEWTCPVCTVINERSNRQCTVCGSPNPHADAGAVASSAHGPWICGVCTLENEAGARRCVGCNTRNPAAPPLRRRNPPVVQEGHWVCYACSGNNHGGSSCGLCGTPGPSRQYVAPKAKAKAGSPTALSSTGATAPTGQSPTQGSRGGTSPARPLPAAATPTGGGGATFAGTNFEARAAGTFAVGDKVKARTKLKWDAEGNPIPVTKKGSFFKVVPGHFGSYLGVRDNALVIAWDRARGVEPFQGTTDPTKVMKMF